MFHVPVDSFAEDPGTDSHNGPSLDLEARRPPEDSGFVVVPRPPWQRSDSPRRLPFQKDRIAKLVSPVAVIIESSADPPQHRVVSERAQQLVMAVAWLVNAGHDGVNDAELGTWADPLVGDACADGEATSSSHPAYAACVEVNQMNTHAVAGRISRRVLVIALCLSGIPHPTRAASQEAHKIPSPTLPEKSGRTVHTLTAQARPVGGLSPRLLVAPSVGGSVVTGADRQSTTEGWVFGFDLGGAAISLEHKPSDRAGLSALGSARKIGEGGKGEVYRATKCSQDFDLLTW